MRHELREKPDWLEKRVPGDMWCSVAGTAYFPKGVDPQQTPWIIEHEFTHCDRQGGVVKFWGYWYPRYLTSKEFRLREELIAIKAEIMAMPSALRREAITRYAYQLRTGYAPTRFNSSPLEGYSQVAAELHLITRMGLTYTQL